MKTIATSAIALILASGTAFAESHTSNDEADMNSDTSMSSGDSYSSDDLMGMQGDLIRSRDITGGNVYTTNAANDEGWDSENSYTSVGTDWNQIGEIEDLILTQDGQIRGIVAEVGGFLDVADKHVVISVDDLNLVAVDDATYAYVTRYSEEELESREGVDEGFWN
ncbi:PRC-barrel domain-containing protein [Palleronia abyssalis]|uniref:PRC-barrel domain-containing protein n=1 Tax=Palleronia abyssalis TaxID=1501240 RepID=A0A2R8BUX1_9RHOB|nr:PRC-barrel domain-containing protein [Palleronia abyssalis]SPJ23958.1 hypothetical protein PAA8504_01779 [Palleronia abyssalis]